MVIDQTPDQIIIPLQDHVRYGTVMKKDALFVSLTHRQDPETKACSASIEVLIRLYAVGAGDTYGPPYWSAGVHPYTETLVADDETVVEFGDPAGPNFGRIRGIRKLMNDADWAALLAGPVDLRYQGDFFQWLRDHAPLVIGNMIRQHIQQADTMGRFA